MDSLTVVGVGHMGEALLAGFLRAGFLPADRVQVVCRRPARLAYFKEAYGVRGSCDPVAACRDAAIVLLALKPADTVPMLRVLQPPVPGPLFISVAAGVSLAALAAALPPGSRCCRAMPNTPVRIGAGATALAAGEHVGPADLKAALGLFACVGYAVQVTDAQMDAVTGVSGAGPAFVLLMVEALAQAGEALGLSPGVARALAAQTAVGSGRLAQQSDLPAGALAEQVMSPGGATEAGVAVLRERQLEAGLRAAVQAAALAAGRLTRV
jgi:pyrroline-5-carboxylate reductase